MSDRAELVRTIEKLVYGAAPDEWSGRQLYDELTGDEQILADAYLDVFDKIGPYDLADEIYVGYVDGADNEDAAIGVKCGNCALVASEVRCRILDQIIEHEGVCRFSVIPPGYVGG